MKLIGALLTILLSVSAFATDQPTIDFDLSRISIDGDNILYQGINSHLSTSQVRLPVSTYYVELSEFETLDQIMFERTDETIVATNPGISSGSDQPTSDNNSYDDIVSSAIVEKLGQDPVFVSSVYEYQGRRFARLEILPLYSGEDNQLLFSSAITIKINDRLIDSSELLPVDQVIGIDEKKSSRLNQSGATGTEFIIVSSGLFTSALEQLLRHRIATGTSTEIADIDEIISLYSGVDDAERLREYLRDFYQNGGKYVLLVGDETVLPVRYSYPYSIATMPELDQLQLCDLYFADLSSDWDVDGDLIFGERDIDLSHLAPELGVGRLPFNTVEEVKNYIDKLIVYETNPGMGQPEYLERAFFFSADHMRDYLGIGQHATIAKAYPDNFEIDTVSGVEASSGTDLNPSSLPASGLIEPLSSGFGIVSVINHGRADGFAVRTSGWNEWPKSYFISDAVGGSDASFEHLPENNKSAFYYSLSCDNAGFDLDQPPVNFPNRNMAQTLLGQAGGGAIGFVGYSRWGWVSSSHYLQKTYFDSLFANPQLPAIEAMYKSQAAHYYYRDLIYGQNFLGDPNLKVYTTVPATIDLLATTVVGGMAFYSGSNGQAVSGCKIVVSQDNAVVGQIITGADGHGFIPMTFDSSRVYKVAAVKTGFVTNIKSYSVGLATSVDDEVIGLPSDFALGQNYPNPFNPATIIPFELPVRSHVTVVVYNLLGQHVNVLTAQSFSAGSHTLQWDGNDSFGRPMGTGVYLYRIVADDFVDVRKMLLLK